MKLSNCERRRKEGRKGRGCREILEALRFFFFEI